MKSGYHYFWLFIFYWCHWYYTILLYYNTIFISIYQSLSLYISVIVLYSHAIFLSIISIFFAQLILIYFRFLANLIIITQTVIKKHFTVYMRCCDPWFAVTATEAVLEIEWTHSDQLEASIQNQEQRRRRVRSVGVFQDHSSSVKSQILKDTCTNGSFRISAQPLGLFQLFVLKPFQYVVVKYVVHVFTEIYLQWIITENLQRIIYSWLFL